MLLKRCFIIFFLIIYNVEATNLNEFYIEADEIQSDLKNNLATVKGNITIKNSEFTIQADTIKIYSTTLVTNSAIKNFTFAKDIQLQNIIIESKDIIKINLAKNGNINCKKVTINPITKILIFENQVTLINNHHKISSSIIIYNYANNIINIQGKPVIYSTVID